MQRRIAIKRPSAGGGKRTVQRVRYQAFAVDVDGLDPSAQEFRGRERTVERDRLAQDDLVQARHRLDAQHQAMLSSGRYHDFAGPGL